MSGNEGKSDPPEKNILVTTGNDRDPYGKGGGQSGSGNGSGWNIGFGSGEGSGFFSGGFGGSSRKKAKKRAKARKRARAQQRAEAEAKARAEAEAQAQAQQEAAHRQLITALSQNHSAERAEVDLAYASKSAALTQRLESEIIAAKRAPGSPGNERWQLFLISKEKSELDVLIGHKNNQFAALNAQAHSFNGRNPLTQSVHDYQNSLAQYSANNPALVHDAHSKWESSYLAANEARVLSESIRILSEKSQALAVHYAEQEVKWRESDARAAAFQLHEKRREEQREKQIKFKSRTDEDLRRHSIRTANTLQAPHATLAAGAVVWGRGGVLVGEGAAVALETSITAALKELGRIAAIRAGQTLSVSLSALLYSEPLGNGELTPEQRRRIFQGVSVSADALGLQRNVDLPAIAAAGGSVELATRIKAIPVERGTELIGVTTGAAIPARVPVIEAVFDPLTDTYQAQTQGLQPKHLVISSVAAAPDSAVPKGVMPKPEIFTSEPQTSDVPAGVDTRINDCIVCFPEQFGLAPQYVSFVTHASDLGVVIGSGQIASADWWKQASQNQGVAVPTQVGEQLRYREFSSVEAFDNSTWRAIAEDSVLSKQFDEINLKRMIRGFPPIAPKSSWVGERGEFEFRNSQAANDAGIYFNLDQLSINKPNSTHGVQRLTPTFLPWPVSNGGTWTPLVPPGSETLGPTELPIETEQPTLYPGETTDPAGSQNESLPAVDPDDVNASIPGFGEGDDLPSPDLVFNNPNRDHRYFPKPSALPAFPNAKWARPKTQVQSGGKQRPRWIGEDGTIYEWDFQHGTVEKYNKRGRHLGEFDHLTGVELKPADSSRRIEP